MEQYSQEGTLKLTVNPKNKLSIIHIIVSKQRNNPDTTNSLRMGMSRLRIQKITQNYSRQYIL
jgi:hypothetical protein